MVFYEFIGSLWQSLNMCGARILIQTHMHTHAHSQHSECLTLFKTEHVGMPKQTLKVPSGNFSFSPYALCLLNNNNYNAIFKRLTIGLVHALSVGTADRSRHHREHYCVCAYARVQRLRWSVRSENVMKNKKKIYINKIIRPLSRRVPFLYIYK